MKLNELIEKLNALVNKDSDNGNLEVMVNDTMVGFCRIDAVWINDIVSVNHDDENFVHLL